jgi:hypothetical protein
LRKLKRADPDLKNRQNGPGKNGPGKELQSGDEWNWGLLKQTKILQCSRREPEVTGARARVFCVWQDGQKSIGKAAISK